MERIEPKGRPLLSVRRGYARCRLESGFLACAYERVVPQIGKAVVHDRLRNGLTLHPPAAVGA